MKSSLINLIKLFLLNIYRKTNKQNTRGVIIGDPLTHSRPNIISLSSYIVSQLNTSTWSVFILPHRSISDPLYTVQLFLSRQWCLSYFPLLTINYSNNNNNYYQHRITSELSFLSPQCLILVSLLVVGFCVSVFHFYKV